jgi:hypothetical protein
MPVHETFVGIGSYCCWAAAVSALFLFLESTFIDQNNPKRQTAGPLWGSPKLDLSGLVYGGLPGVGPWPDSRF